MAQERGYDARVMPQAGAPLPMASARTYGAELAETVDQAAQDMHRRELRAYQVQRQRAAEAEASRSNRDFANFRIGHDEWSRQRQAQGYDGYTVDVMQRIDAAQERAKEGVTEDSVRASIDAKFDAYRTAEHDRAMVWEEGQRIGTEIVADENSSDAVAAMLTRDPSRLKEELTFGLLSIEEKSWDPKLKAEQQARRIRKYTAATGQGLAVTNPAELQAMIGRGEFDVLGPAGVRALQNMAQGTVNQQVATAKEEVRALEARRDRGEVIPQGDWERAASFVESAGDKAWAEKLRGHAEDAQFDQVWGPTAAMPLQRQQRMAALAAKGDGRSQAENREFKYLQDNSGKFASAFDSDSMGLMIERGGIAPIDWSDPASLARRSRDRRAAAAAAGREVAFASNAELAALRDEYGAGRAGELSVLRTLDGIDDDMDRDRVARQVAPNDANFRHLAQVRPQQREMVIRGQAALKANPQMLTVPDANPRAKDRIGKSMTAIEDEVRRAFRGMSAEYADQAVQTAREYMAGALWKDGAGNVADGYSEARHREAVRVALGGYNKGGNTPIGGIGHWVSPERAFVVPDGFTEIGFEVGVARDRRRQEREGRGPVDRDGRTPFDLKNATPVMIAPGMYRWETRAGVVMNGRGERFISFVRAGE